MPPSAKTKSLHSTCVVINGRGILIMGKPGTGKSTLALSLLKHGHQLLSDDLTTVTRHGNQLIATCPPSIKNLLLVNGVGLMDVTEYFGRNSAASTARINTIIHLITHRTEIQKQAWDILGINILAYFIKVQTPPKTAYFFPLHGVIPLDPRVSLRSPEDDVASASRHPTPSFPRKRESSIKNKNDIKYSRNSLGYTVSV